MLENHKSMKSRSEYNDGFRYISVLIIKEFFRVRSVGSALIMFRNNMNKVSSFYVGFFYVPANWKSWLPGQ